MAGITAMHPQSLVANPSAAERADPRVGAWYQEHPDGAPAGVDDPDKAEALVELAESREQANEALERALAQLRRDADDLPPRLALADTIIGKSPDDWPPAVLRFLASAGSFDATWRTANWLGLDDTPR